MIGSNHFSYSQERLHCDYVTNILQKEIILGIPDQIILYNFINASSVLQTLSNLSNQSSCNIYHS